MDKNLQYRTQSQRRRFSLISYGPNHIENYFDKTSRVDVRMCQSSFCIKSRNGANEMVSVKFQHIATVIFAFVLLTNIVVSAGVPQFLSQQITDSPSRTQLFLLRNNKRILRSRRTKAVCTPEDYAKPGVQEAVFKMIVGSKEAAPIVSHMSKPELRFESSGSCSEIDENQSGGSGMKLGFDISPDMPLEMRAICSFDYEENIDEKRIPRSIREVKCLCKIPQQTEGIRCEPIYNDVPVLLFDETCTSFREHVQPIAFACVPVLTSQSHSTYSVSIGSSGKNGELQI